MCKSRNATYLTPNTTRNLVTVFLTKTKTKAWLSVLWWENCNFMYGENFFHRDTFTRIRVLPIFLSFFSFNLELATECPRINSIIYRTLKNAAQLPGRIFPINLWLSSSSLWANNDKGPLHVILTGFFWLLSHVIYLKLTRVLYWCTLSQAEWRVVELLFLSGLNFLQNKCFQFSQI